MAAAVNAQYSSVEPGSLLVRIGARMRRRMFDLFLERSAIQPHHTLLDVGATSDRAYESSNYVEAWYPFKERVTAVGVDDAGFLTRVYPGLTFVRAAGKALPFDDGAFDFVHSSAVIEHVGSRVEQRRFIEELTRVARRGAFLTTPNRWFPVEFHTLLPLVHWLPEPRFRALLRRTGRASFADERTLNLLGRRDLARLCAGLEGCRVQIESLSLLGWPSNLVLFVKRAPGKEQPQALARAARVVRDPAAAPPVTGSSRP